MITKVTKESSALYQALFAKAGTALHGTETTISSLDEYFTHLAELKAANENVFTFLPLDEPLFEINANTRAITIPSEFKKNGISVKGDHYAETLYFTVDRYFDTVDLYDPSIKIYIQWEDAQGNDGVSAAIFRDVTIFKTDGKLLFGWAINNTITKNLGNVKFSVRFFRADENNNLLFSLSTLTSVVAVNSGLDFAFDTNGKFDVDVENTFEDDANLLLGRMQNSILIPGTVIIENPPTWTKTIDPSTQDSTVTKDIEQSTLLSVSARPATEGFVSYTWHSAFENGNVRNITGNEDYVLSADREWDTEKIYYKRSIIDNNTSYIPVDQGEYAENTAPISVPLYEYCSMYTIDPNEGVITGEYYVTAKTMLAAEGGFAQSAEIESQHVLVPGPTALTLTEPAAATNHVFLTEGTATLTAQGSTSNSAKDKIDYQWFVGASETADLEDFNKLQSATSSYVVEVENSESVRKAFDETFTVKAVAKRNGSLSEEKTASFRVTEAPHAPVVRVDNTNNKAYLNSNNVAVATVSVTNDVEIANDGFRYVWYKVTSIPGEEASDLDDIAIENATFEKMKSTSTPEDPYTVCDFEIHDTNGSYAGSDVYCKVYTIIAGVSSEEAGRSANITVARG